LQKNFSVGVMNFIHLITKDGYTIDIIQVGEFGSFSRKSKKSASKTYSLVTHLVFCFTFFEFFS